MGDLGLGCDSLISGDLSVLGLCGDAVRNSAATRSALAGCCGFGDPCGFRYAPRLPSA